jgi:hypothetical protein
MCLLYRIRITFELDFLMCQRSYTIECVTISPYQNVVQLTVEGMRAIRTTNLEEPTMHILVNKMQYPISVLSEHGMDVVLQYGISTTTFG